MSAIHAAVRALPVLAGALLAFAAGAVAQPDDLCGRQPERPEVMLERLSKGEKLREIHRDKAYAVLNDEARNTIWTFTVAGHPAHPSAVCRHVIKDGDGRLRIEMGVTCFAQEAECEKLVSGFQELNQRMIQDLEKQQKK